MRMECDDLDGGSALVGAKQMQRTIYNLLLNACQSARKAKDRREVHVEIRSQDGKITVRITDSGPGVAEHIRNSLFQPLRVTSAFSSAISCRS